MFNNFFDINKENFAFVKFLQICSYLGSLISFILFATVDYSENIDGYFSLSILLLILALYFSFIIKKYKKNIIVEVKENNNFKSL